MLHASWATRPAGHRTDRPRHHNYVTGDYFAGRQRLLGGATARSPTPVEEITIAGNLREMFANVVAVAPTDSSGAAPDHRNRC